MFCKKGVLTNVAKFTRKHLRERLAFNEVGDLQSLTLSKKDILAQMFTCKFCEISHNAFFKETLWWLLLHKHSFWCHTYFPAEYFLGLIYRLGTRISSRFQTFSQTPTTQSNICDGAFFSKMVNSLKPLSIFGKKSCLVDVRPGSKNASVTSH